MNNRLLVDGHGHWHDALSPIDFLDSARHQFRSAGRLSTGETLQAILCLADFAGAEGWSRLKIHGEQSSVGAWRLSSADDEAMLATHEQGDRLWLIAGRQIVTTEKLEVMALGTAGLVVDGLSLKDTLGRVRALGALPVLPWGAGKWWGRRGQLVKEVLQGETKLLLGDNGGRPRCWRPSLLSCARRLGVSVLPGSDPLPVATDRRRNGAYGVVMTEPLRDAAPTAWLKERLMALSADCKVFGGTLSFFSFVSCQRALRNKGEAV